MECRRYIHADNCADFLQIRLVVVELSLSEDRKMDDRNMREHLDIFLAPVFLSYNQLV